MISNQTIEQIIIDFIKDSPENSMKMKIKEPAWEEALVGFSAGDDPLFEDFKEHVGDFHFTPLEIFNLTFPDKPAVAEDLTVISWILPQREATRRDNAKEDMYPAERWVMARFPGEAFNDLLRHHIVNTLKDTLAVFYRYKMGWYK